MSIVVDPDQIRLEDVMGNMFLQLSRNHPRTAPSRMLDYEPFDTYVYYIIIT